MPVRVRSMFGPLVAAYAITVIAVDHLVATGAIPLNQLASSPVGLLRGRLWTMLSSGLVSAGDLPIVQTVALAVVLVAFAARHGGRLVLGTALAAHVGSAMLAYAGLLLVTDTGIASDHADLISPDYGTSCVWLGCVAGWLAIELVPLRGRRLAAGLALAIGILAILPWGPVAEDPLTTAEHLLAIAIGAGIAAATGLGGRVCQALGLSVRPSVTNRASRTGTRVRAALGCSFRRPGGEALGGTHHCGGGPTGS